MKIIKNKRLAIGLIALVVVTLFMIWWFVRRIHYPIYQERLPLREPQ